MLGVGDLEGMEEGEVVREISRGESQQPERVVDVSELSEIREFHFIK